MPYQNIIQIQIKKYIYIFFDMIDQSQQEPYPLELTLQTFQQYNSYPDLENSQYIDANKRLLLKKYLDKGAFGFVYLCEDKDEKKYAAKFQNLHMFREENEKVMELFQNEVKNMRKCQGSNNIAQLHSVYENQGQQKDFRVLIIEYCDGGTLEKYIEHLSRDIRQRQRQCLIILNQILRGIGDLHSKEIIHRDLKTTNIMFSDNRVKIIDLGISKMLDLEHQYTSTLLGSPITMAPELNTKRENYSKQIDLWAAGIILYYMLKEQYPFFLEREEAIDKSYEQIVQLIKIKIYTKLDQVRQNRQNFFSKQMAHLISKLLEYNPNDRYNWQQALQDPIFQFYGIHT